MGPVDWDLFADRSAQEIDARNAEFFRLRVEKCVFDGSDRHRHDAGERLTGLSDEFGPDSLGRLDGFADQRRGHLFQHRSEPGCA